MAITQFIDDLQRARLVILEGALLQRQQLAETLVRHLGDRVNLGAVVSKYIGETEKNLDRLFAEANHSGGILFFDEADALFGKRSEVKDSHDRYASLARRLDSFQGQVIIGVENRNSIPPDLQQRCKVLPVNDYWPPG
jgi:hypothetical protein